MNTYDTALSWRAQGISPIPCHPHSKLPRIAWSKYQHALPHPKLLNLWFQNDSNLALVAGGAQNLAVLDFDRPDTFLAFTSHYPRLAQTYTVQTPRGAHLYYHTDQPLPTYRTPSFELRANGAYVLTAPSIHPSGAPYRVQSDLPIQYVPTTALLLALPMPHTKHTEQIKPSTRPFSDPLSLVQTIKTQFPLLDMVAQYTYPLPSSRNGRWFIARCPFPASHPHGDRSPSFWIDAHRQMCSCFTPACRAENPQGRAMDTVNFHARLHNLTNTEAITELWDKLSQEYGVTMI